MAGSGVPTVMPNARVFDGLDHLRHAAASGGVGHSTGVGQHISEPQGPGSQVLNLPSADRDESDHDTKNQENHEFDKTPKGGGKGDP